MKDLSVQIKYRWIFLLFYIRESKNLSKLKNRNCHEAEGDHQHVCALGGRRSFYCQKYLSFHQVKLNTGFFFIVRLPRAFDVSVYVVNLQIVYFVFQTSFIILHNQATQTHVNGETLNMCTHFDRRISY